MRNGNVTRQKLLSFTSNIPSFPEAAQRVMRMLRDPRVQLTKVGEVVSLDQGFAGKVLRMANSAYFGLPRRVCNVTEAIVLLGFSNLRNVLISASVGHLLFDSLESYGLAAGKLWEHSVGSAYATQILSKQVDMRLYSMAFSTGLLHDVGKVAIDRALEKEIRGRLFDMAGLEERNRAEQKVVGVTHAEASGEICRRWNLPDEIVEAVAYHHEPNRSASGSKLASIVAAANRLANLLLEGKSVISTSDFASAPGGTYMPDRATVEKVSEDLPLIVASSKELLQGMSEVKADEVGTYKK